MVSFVHHYYVYEKVFGIPPLRKNIHVHYYRAFGTDKPAFARNPRFAQNFVQRGIIVYQIAVFIYLFAHLQKQIPAKPELVFEYVYPVVENLVGRDYEQRFHFTAYGKLA